MKKILIICEYFAPQNLIGAVRPTKIAKYLKIDNELDCEISVLTKKNIIGQKENDAFEDLKYVDNFYYSESGKFATFLMDFFSMIGKTKIYKQVIHDDIAAESKSKKQRIKDKLVRKIKFLLSILYNKSYSSNAWKLISQKGNGIDTIISTYGPFSSHLIALEFKKKYKDVNWIADFRDPAVTELIPKECISYCSRFTKKVTNSCDEITVVSEGMIDALGIKKSERVHVITNGYDEMDRSVVEGIKKKDNKLHFTYCGSIYIGKRKLSMLFNVLNDLISKRILDKNRIILNYAGAESAEFYSQACTFQLQNCVEDHGLLTRTKSLQLQEQSDVLLLASWNTKKSNGIITGKFYEYLMMKKPIICTITGDLENSILKTMINKMNCGICCEEAAIEVDRVKLYEYVKKIYLEFEQTGSIEYKPNVDEIEKYNYKEIAKQFSALIKK